MLIGFNVYKVHGGMKEQVKMSRFQSFIEDKRGILLCTDSNIAFGIDIRNVDYVIHYDMPRQHRQYLHRVGLCLCAAWGCGGGVGVRGCARKKGRWSADGSVSSRSLVPLLLPDALCGAKAWTNCFMATWCWPGGHAWKLPCCAGYHHPDIVHRSPIASSASM